MSRYRSPPVLGDEYVWIRMSEYKSRNKDKPDVLELEMVSTETFTGTYSVAGKVMRKEGEKYLPRYLPLKAVSSKYGKLLDLWEKYVKTDKLKPGTRFTIETYLDESGAMLYPARKYKIVVQRGGGSLASSTSVPEESEPRK